MNTHREDAEFLLERARTNPEASEALATAAVAHATLALAEEQRTANLQTYMADTMHARRGVRETPETMAIVDEWISSQMGVIRERLGMEK
ncbi:hypothetical protein SEA_PEPE25_49 [Microbacterium phage Pepe25]|nr:hypothetical protein SEA_PEPE25_49 [Microbacterium phage Pepe25]